MSEITLPPLPDEDVKGVHVDGFSYRAIEDYARAAVELDRQGRGEPAALHAVAEQMYKALCEELAAYAEPIHHVKAAVEAYQAWRASAPQPAEPVKVPSDDELLQLALECCDSTDASGEESKFTTDESILRFARALLARYGQPAASAEPVASDRFVYRTEGDYPHGPNVLDRKTGRWMAPELVREMASVLPVSHAAPIAAQPSVPDGPTDRFMLDVAAELKRARAKFPGDRIMTIALAEEFGELAKAMLDEPGANVWKEAVQTAAMAARVAVDGDGSVDDWRREKGLDNHRNGGRQA